jgi:hypothetical protein
VKQHLLQHKCVAVKTALLWCGDDGKRRRNCNRRAAVLVFNSDEVERRGKCNRYAILM